MGRYIPPSPPRNSHLRYFNLLTTEEQIRSVKRLLASHQTDHQVAALTGLSVELVRQMAKP